MNSGQYDLMVLDEANCAVSAGLFTVDELLAVLDQRPENLEVIVTGRGAAPEITEVADLVTEMRDIKHYADQGVTARKGIEM
jgi:cob(I)alamin adenosyltransferase